MTKTIGIALLLSLPSLAQDPIADLATQPSLAKWQTTHPADQFELANYRVTGLAYAVDFLRKQQWCAASIGSTPLTPKRVVYFHVPSVKAGSLPPLPNQVDLKTGCTLQAVWYELPPQITLDSVVAQLSSKLGKPTAPTGPLEIGVQGSGLWKSVSRWHRDGITVWAALNPRVVIYARRDLPKDVWEFPPFQPTSAVEQSAQIAAIDTPLAAAILTRSQCAQSPSPREASSITTSRLTQWLQLARTLPPQRQAAALLLADFYVSCAVQPADLKTLGAKFELNCPQDGPAYTHNFRDQAKRIGGDGEAGQLAQFVSVQDVCSLRGKQPWPSLVIAQAQSLVAKSPEVDYLLARAHAARLSYTYPDSNIDGINEALSPAEKQIERQAAVDHFRAYLAKYSDAPQAVFAWQESWRLLAGLPPSQLHFGCGCE